MKKIFSLFLVLISILFCFTSCYSEADLEEAKSKAYQEGYNAGEGVGYENGQKNLETKLKNEYDKGYRIGYKDGLEEFANADNDVAGIVNNENSKQVYITPSGKRYHYSSTCGGVNSYKVSINNVGSRTPCQKCAGG